MFKTGLTLGKFMPPHKGHEYLIDFASKLCEHLIVIVCGQETDEIPVSLRYWWLKIHYDGYPQIKFILDQDEIPVTDVDENGTCTDPEFWKKWKHRLHSITHKFPIDAIFTSDHYGERLAKEIGATWVPVDPKREIFQISATDIRNNQMEYFSYLMNEAKSHYVKKIVIVGPESTGKTILTEKLACDFDTAYVPEYGRILSELKNNKLTEDDFKLIANAQEAITEILIKGANGIIFQDTELLTTYLFGKIYLNMDLTYLKARAKTQKFDLYILLAPTVDWIDDGLRILSSDLDRWTFFVNLKELLDEFEKPYIIVDQNTFPERNKFVKGKINGIL